MAEDWLRYCHEEDMGGMDPVPDEMPALVLPPAAEPLDELWAAALGQLRLQVDPASYDAWLRNTRLGQRDEAWILVAHDADAREWLAHRLASLIRKTLVGLVGEAERGLEIIVAE